MFTWCIYIPADNKEERWTCLASAKTIEAMSAIIESLMSTDATGPQVIRIEKLTLPCD